MRYYCTLCDYAYLPRALVLYESLLKHSSKDFQFFLLAMDDATEGVTIDYNIATGSNIAVMPLHTLTEGFLGAFLEGRSRKLAEAQTTRTWQEFCWTCASQLAEFYLETNAIHEITYLDADLMFFSNPEQVFDEIGDRSIGIIPHRFIPEKQYLAVNGQFNVSWVSFKNTPVGRDCLSTWARQVREKCSATDGCGDQKYLDEWPAKYGDEVCIIQNPGAGLAPWNMANYEITGDWPNYWGEEMTDCPQVDGRDVVFFHAHEFRDEHGKFVLSNYIMRDEDVQLIWERYCQAYKRAKETIASLHLQT